MYSMRKVGSDFSELEREDSNTDEVCRNPSIDPFLRHLCGEQHRSGPALPMESERATGPVCSGPMSSDTPLLDHLIEDGYGPKASPTFTKTVYDKHASLVEDTTLELGGHGQSIKRLNAVWDQNREKYEAVAAQVDLPAELIAALHYRESSFDFQTYLHQGDPLGKAAVHWPNNIPIFNEWAPAATHALGLKSRVQKDVGLTQDSSDLAAMATYAEYYNGLGYHNREQSSPYVYGGTDQYERGHYVADGRFDANAKDRRLGVMAIVRSLKGLVTDEEMQGVSRLPFSSGDRTISLGKKGSDVKLLQELLNGAGATLLVDGDAGRATDSAIRQFQEEAGLTVDGVVGPKTLEALRAKQPAAACSIDKGN